MTTGAKYSGIAHLAFILIVLFGGLPWWSGEEREAIRVSEVSFISPEEFERAASGGQDAPEPEAAPAPAAPEPVEATPEPTPPEPEVQVVRPSPPPEPAPEPEADAAPTEQATLAPEFDPDSPLGLESPEQQRAPRIISVNPSPLSAVAPPQPRQVARIEPDPAPPPPEEALPAPEPEVATEVAPEPAEPVEELAAAPPEAATEAAPETPPTPEPEAVPETVALTSSIPPRARPASVAARAAPEPEPVAEPEPERTQTAAATPATPPSETAPTEPTTTQPTGATAPAASSLPSGPPITQAERDGLRLAVQRCWNVPAGLRNAQELRVVLAAELAADGAVVDGSIRLLEPSPLPDARFQQAYEAGRRALLRCQPYNGLPQEKYARWRNLEVVFNPEGMVSW